MDLQYARTPSSAVASLEPLLLSVVPGLGGFAGRSVPDDLSRHFTVQIGAPARIGTPAVPATITVFEPAGVVRILGFRHEFVEQVDRLIQVVIIHPPAEYIELACELGTLGSPVLLEVVPDVVMLLRPLGYIVIDFTRHRIPEWL